MRPALPDAREVAVGYYVISTQALLTSSPGFLGGQTVSGASATETFAALDEAQAARHRELRSGQVEARGNEPLEPAPPTPGLEVDPPCGFCDFALLCGRALGGDA